MRTEVAPRNFHDPLGARFLHAVTLRLYFTKRRRSSAAGRLLYTCWRGRGWRVSHDIELHFLSHYSTQTQLYLPRTLLLPLPNLAAQALWVGVNAQQSRK